MKKRISDNSQNVQQEKMIENAIKTSGFLFPETVEEVKEFERIYGTTDVTLPLELQEPIFLYSNSEENNTIGIVNFSSENFAMAAREASSEIPKEIQQKIIKDIEDIEKKQRRKNN